MALGKAVGKYRDFGVLILRAGIGLMFMYAHGSGKLFGGPERWAGVGAAMQNLGIGFAPEFWGMLSAIVEFFGGFFLVLGLYVRPAALLLTFNMLVATLSIYAKTHELRGPVAHPLEIGIMMLALFFIGAGKYSLDQKLGYN